MVLNWIIYTVRAQLKEPLARDGVLCRERGSAGLRS
jgi:hypothetical protein